MKDDLNWRNCDCGACCFKEGNNWLCSHLACKTWLHLRRCTIICSLLFKIASSAVQTHHLGVHRHWVELEQVLVCTAQREYLPPPGPAQSRTYTVPDLAQSTVFSSKSCASPAAVNCLLHVQSYNIVHLTLTLCCSTVLCTDIDKAEAGHQHDHSSGFWQSFLLDEELDVKQCWCWSSALTCFAFGLQRSLEPRQPLV